MLSVSVKTCFKKPFAVEEIFFRRRRAFLCLYGYAGQSFGLGFRPRFRGAGASGGMTARMRVSSNSG